jgi:2-polyprenyl-3-methyl-5-hydroxy-6-metoxy-1,4-benzoquinol methylase
MLPKLFQHILKILKKEEKMTDFFKMVLYKLGIVPKQPLEEIEKFYEKEDPWGYKSILDDQIRKEKIIKVLNQFHPYKFKKALDIGCGEGWITEELPAEEIIGIDISQKAIERARKNAKNAKYYVGDINLITLPSNYFDLIVATGVLYRHYINRKTVKKIEKALSPKGFLISCHIKEMKRFDPNLPILYKEEFSYRGKTEKIILYQK